MLDEKKNPARAIRDINAAQNRDSILYCIEGNTDLDKFTPKINEAINDFENWLRPHIKKH